MGNGLDSLHDHTIDVTKNNNMKDFHLYIDSAQVIEDAIGVNYFASFLELLKRTGIPISIDR